MAVPVNTFQTYQNIKALEDVSDIVEKITPIDTPFLSALSKEGVSGTLHEWHTQEHDPIGINAQIEGDEFVNDPIIPAERLNNYTQIFRKTAQVSATNQAIKKAGGQNEMGEQMALKSQSLKVDVEAALLSSANGIANAPTGVDVVGNHAGAAGTARRFRSIEGWNTANVDLGAGGVAAVYTTGAWTAPTAGATRPFTEAIFLTLTESLYSAGGTGADTVYCGPKQRLEFNKFTGTNQQKIIEMEGSDTLRNSFSVYISPLGTYKLVTDRHVRASTIHVLDMSTWSRGVLRDYTTHDLAKTGDSMRRAIVTEMTLLCQAPTKNGAIYDLA
jgi:Family of unknown function (DUF5309)